jgi:hypothetical protein
MSKTMISFRTWALHEYKNEDKMCHDFLGDLKSDREFPRVDSWKALESYLIDECNACEAAVNAGRKIWKAYIKAMNKGGASRRGHSY